MALISNIIKIIEEFAPPETAEEWDNSGWQINLHNEETKNILSCLTVTEDVLDLAVNLGCDLIIAHHPLIFSPVKKLENPIHINAIRNNVQIYSAHTNFDKANGGTTDILAQKLNLQDIKSVNDYVKCGSLPFKMTLEKFIPVLKTTLELNNVKLINKSAKPEIEKIAICAGSGAEFIRDVGSCDAYITSDIKYHSALDVKNMVLLDIGHFESEKFFSEKIKEIFALNGIEITAANEKPAWTFV